MPSNNPDFMKNLKHFSSTYQPKNAGRKPSKLKKFIKDNGLSSLDASLIAKSLLGLSREKLKTYAGDEKLPVMISGAAKALLQDIRKGSVYVQQWLYDRAFGKAVQPLEHSGGVFLDKMPPELRKARLEELMEKYRKKEEPSEPEKKD